jgi:predicted RNase H-like HicB family nuclease
MKHYPILFSRRDLVEAAHFTAGVIVAGRVLVKDEDGEFWAEGVNPGGLAAKGETATAAMRALCKSYHEVLLDIAEDETSFEGFKKAVERFFADTSMAALEEWDKAVVEVRAGKLSLDNEMGKRPSESPLGISVLSLDDEAKNEEVGDLAIAA